MPIEIRELTVKAVVRDDDAAESIAFPPFLAPLDHDASGVEAPATSDTLVLLLDDGF